MSDSAQDDRDKELAPLMFDAYLRHRSLQRKVDNAISETVGENHSWGYLWFDYYDGSVEFKDADNDLTLRPEDHKLLFYTLGFRRAWACHKDGTETYWHRHGEVSGSKRPPTA